MKGHQSFLAPPGEGTERRWASISPKENFTKNHICWHLDLGLPSFQSCEKYLLFKPPSLYYFVMVAHAKRDRIICFSVSTPEDTESSLNPQLTFIQVLERIGALVENLNQKILSRAVHL